MFKASKDFTLPPLHGKRCFHAHGAAGPQGPVDPHVLAPALSQRQVDGTFPYKKRALGVSWITHGNAEHRRFQKDI